MLCKLNACWACRCCSIVAIAAVVNCNAMLQCNWIRCTVAHLISDTSPKVGETKHLVAPKAQGGVWYRAPGGAPSNTEGFWGTKADVWYKAGAGTMARWSIMILHHTSSNVYPTDNVKRCWKHRWQLLSGFDKIAAMIELFNNSIRRIRRIPMLLLDIVVLKHLNQRWYLSSPTPWIPGNMARKTDHRIMTAIFRQTNYMQKWNDWTLSQDNYG